MKQLLEKKFFPYVIKPARYAGGEPGQIVKAPEGRFKLLLASCERYETAQPSSFLQKLYHLVNSDDRFLAERVFSPEIDAEQLMKENNIPLFSLESYHPAARFDLIAFILYNELSCCNLPALLDLAGIPLISKERGNDGPIILALGPAVNNPEPLAEFVDVFLLGDAAESFLDSLNLVHQESDSSKEAKLGTLAAKISSAYVPHFYDAEHNPKVKNAPPTIRITPGTQLKASYYPEIPILPMIETLPAYLGIVLSNLRLESCSDKPPQFRPANEIINQIEKQVQATGYDEVRLLADSSITYPDLEQLLARVAKQLGPHRAALSITPVLPGTVSETMLDALRKVRRTPITLNIVAANERLRNLMGLGFSNDDIYESAELIAKHGWHAIYLKFKIDLPTETAEDLVDIGNVVRNVSSIGSDYYNKFNTNVRIAPFVPLPHTRFQLDGSADSDTLNSKINYIKKCCRAKNVHFRLSGVNSAPIRVALSRGTRTMSRVVLAAYRNGCRFDGASPTACLANWQKAFEECDMPINELLQPIPIDSPLPWSHIDYGKTAEQLRMMRQQISTHSVRKPSEPRRPEPRKTSVDASKEFGRGKKKVTSRSLTAPTSSCVRIRWGRTDRHRYLSHLDNIRAIERTIRRAGFPVAYSQSAHPKMKLSFCPPLPLGFTSETEFVDINLDQSLTTSMVDSFRTSLPEGFELLETRSVFAKSISLSEAINRIVYILPLDNGIDVDKIRQQAKCILDQETVEIVRQSKSGEATINIRSAIYDINVDADQITLALGVGDGGYVRPTEIARLLFNLNDKSESALKFHRREMYRQVDENTRIPAIEL